MTMHDVMRELFPLNRSLTGNGVRQTMRILSDFAPFNVYEIPSNTQVGVLFYVPGRKKA